MNIIRRPARTFKLLSNYRYKYNYWRFYNSKSNSEKNEGKTKWSKEKIITGGKNLFTTSIPMFFLTGIAVVLYSELYEIPKLKEELGDDYKYSKDKIIIKQYIYIDTNHSQQKRLIIELNPNNNNDFFQYDYNKTVITSQINENIPSSSIYYIYYNIDLNRIEISNEKKDNYIGHILNKKSNFNKYKDIYINKVGKLEKRKKK